MAIAGTTIPLDSTDGMDKVTQTEKVTTPYFSDSEAILAGSDIVTSSLSDTNENYFFGISNSSTPTVEEFNVAFGSLTGIGALTGSQKKSRTEAVYRQYANILLAPTEVTGGFQISSAGSSPAIASGKDDSIFVLSSKRTNMKDRINKDSWLISLSGSYASGIVGTDVLHLTDDSAGQPATATPAGDRYNIISCSSAGVPLTLAPATTTNFGYFYPDAGILVFSQAELSRSIGGGSSTNGAVSVQPGADTVIGFNSSSHKGFATGTTGGQHNDTKQALRFVNCLTTGGSLKFRDEEDQISAQYFCRVRSRQANFSNNPTFVSGSANKLRNEKMRGNPQTFITGVQMYNQQGDVVAVANLSTPLKKNFSSEATIKVKLTY